MTSDSSRAESTAPHIGRIIPGYVIPVIDERAVRAGAGILFLLGGVAFPAGLR